MTCARENRRGIRFLDDKHGALLIFRPRRSTRARAELKVLNFAFPVVFFLFITASLALLEVLLAIQLSKVAQSKSPPISSLPLFTLPFFSQELSRPHHSLVCCTINGHFQARVSPICIRNSGELIGRKRRRGNESIPLFRPPVRLAL